MAEAYLRGAATTSLARRYDVTHPTIAACLQKLGILRRSRSETNRMRAPVDLAELRRLTDLAILSQAEIAQHLGVSQATVERTLRRLDLKSKRGHGSPMEKNYFWQGGQRREKEGYILVKKPDHPSATKAGYVREHRLVMETKLGRFLTRSEVVHHMDGDPRNNHPDNLEVFASNAAHLSHEWKTSWAEKRRALRQRQAKRRPTGHRKSSSSRAASKSDAAQ